MPITLQKYDAIKEMTTPMTGEETNPLFSFKKYHEDDPTHFQNLMIKNDYLYEFTGYHKVTPEDGTFVGQSELYAGKPNGSNPFDVTLNLRVSSESTTAHCSKNMECWIDHDANLKNLVKADDAKHTIFTVFPSFLLVETDGKTTIYQK